MDLVNLINYLDKRKVFSIILFLFLDNFYIFCFEQSIFAAISNNNFIFGINLIPIIIVFSSAFVVFYYLLLPSQSMFIEDCIYSIGKFFVNKFSLDKTKLYQKFYEYHIGDISRSFEHLNEEIKQYKKFRGDSYEVNKLEKDFEDSQKKLIEYFREKINLFFSLLLLSIVTVLQIENSIGFFLT